MYKFIHKIDEGTWNVIYMSICYSILFTADLTLQNTEKTIVSSIHDDNNEFEVDGYNLLAINYTVFGISLWLGPSTISVIGLRTTITIASILYTIDTGSFATETAWILYTTAATGGVASGLIWTAEAKYLVSNSSMEVVSRNIGIFWTLLNLSTIFGNLFTYFQLRGKEYIDSNTRHWIIYGLTTIAATATIAFTFLRAPKKNAKDIETVVKSNPILELKKTWNIFRTKEIRILCLTFIYAGLQQAFWNGIYSSSIGFTLQFGNKAKQLIPLSGLCFGAGELLGGSWQIFQGQHLRKCKWSRTYIISAGIVAQIVSFALIFINIPENAVFGSTTDKALIESNQYIALFCSLLLGIGDGSLNTQNFSMIALLFPNESAQSCALYKFVKALSVAAAFSISSHLNLHYEIGMLTIVGIIALTAFIYNDISFVKRTKDTHKARTDGMT